MPKFQALHAGITIDGEDLPEYDVQVDDNGKQVSCWIPSEAGKNFSVRWSIAESLTIIAGYVTLDGFNVGGSLCFNEKKECIKSRYHISNTTFRNFSFSAITFTDDDAYLNTPVANLGEIELEIWTVTNIQRKPAYSQVDDITSSNVKVHERSKKVGTHCVRFGDLEEMPPTYFSTSSRVNRLATFVFRYRPLGILQANGIAPLASPAAHPSQNNKRKSRDGDTEDADSADEKEINRRVKELEDELKQLKSRHKKIKVKVEKREYSPRLNEVIDLT
ncbi:hypothetical protein AX14_006981 [Amanita brunnescens Koide BX004]|nr:hypothetical protein AX14_006981 [Amanita brunnescens Koide BX004]